MDGIALETLFLQELTALNSALDLSYKIFYWRTSNGKEMDFVLYGPKGLLAFEIKRTARITSAMLGGLKSFLADYPMAKAYFVYGGNRRMYEGKIEIAPVLEILKNLRALLTRQLQKRPSKRRVGVLEKLYQRHLRPYLYSPMHHGRSSPKVKSILVGKIYT